MVEITGVLKGTPAARHGIRVGDQLVAINGNLIVDVLDYRYYLCEKKLVLSLCRDGKEFSVNIKKGEYDDIGLEFETFLMDKKHSCRNKCIFCFIDQLPRGMRDTLYFKDDDSRLSFLQGNYITMTNLSDEDVERIIKMKMSPINISVHTTNPELRVKMLKNPNAARSLEYLRRFAEAGTEIGCQIVLCRGINDGEELLSTLKDLVSLGEMVESVAVVPAGLTCHRKGLCSLADYDEKSAAEVVDLVEGFAEKQYQKWGSRRVFLSDEFYIRARRALPEAERYEGYPQLDNGVGLLRSLEEDVLFALPDAPKPTKGARYLLFTGTAAADFLRGIVSQILSDHPEITCDVVAVKNRFYGESVTVAGLLTGSDYLAAAKEVDLKRYDAVLISASSLRYERDLFLDGVSLQELSDTLGLPVLPVENGEDIIDKLLGEL